ncbi:MAG: transglycosylase domain-containing protein [Patulibacter minatonensis]
MPRRVRTPRRQRGPEPATRTRLKFIRILVVVVGLLGLSALSVMFGMMMAVAPEVKELQAGAEFKTGQNSQLLDRDGKFLAELTSDDGRVILKSDQIDPRMKQAVVAIEDKRFYQHPGVDLRGIGRAVVRDVTAGSAKEGASTIEQQFVKVASDAVNTRTFSAKIREAALAYHLSQKWSKDKILTEYLNAIYYGNGAYGLESAARTYFAEMNGDDCGTPGHKACAANLRPAQAAMLAGIINSPTANDPVTNPVACQKRRNLVLLNMRNQGMLNPIEYQDALAEPIPAPEQITPPQLHLKDPGSGFFVGWIRSQLIERYHNSPRTAFEGGLKVRTTFDAKLQSAAERSIGTWLTGVGPSAAMVAIDNQTGEVRAMVGGQNFARSPFNVATQGRRQPGSSFKPFILAQALREGISPNSTWESEKKVFTVSKKTGEKFTVNNYDDAYAGITTLAHATAFSDNAVYAQLGVKVGTKKVAKLATQMGIRTPVSSNLAMTLGGLKTGVSPLDMAHAYETFANGGKLTYGTLGAPNRGPVGIKSIGYRSGDRKPIENELKTRRVISPGIAKETTDVLTSVVRIGSGKVANIPGHYVWGKTGTTEDYGDAWFVGGSEDLTVAVWVGYLDGTTPMKREYRGAPVAGGTYPAQIWRTFMLQALGFEQQRRDALCAQLAKKGKKCAEDVKPTTPDIDLGSGGSGTSPVAPTTGSGTTAGSGATGSGPSTGATGGSTAGGTGGTSSGAGGTGGAAGGSTGSGPSTGGTGGTGGATGGTGATGDAGAGGATGGGAGGGAATGGGAVTGGTP